jgi:hypothetical protein
MTAETTTQTTTITAPGATPEERLPALELLSNPAHLAAWARALPEGEHIVYEGCKDCPYARLLAAHGYVAEVYATEVTLYEPDSLGQGSHVLDPRACCTQLIREIDALSNARSSEVRCARALATKVALADAVSPEDRYITREELLTLLERQTG